MEIGYCLDCNELNYAIAKNSGTFQRANMSNNHVGHRQHVFGEPNNYSPPIRNVLTKIQAHAPLGHNEIVLFKLALALDGIDES